nr:unnamed protein product [Callosobruchus analis]CAI5820410.1 unnamed protein product [Callosobruchus analis]CAI5821446.1 unnamed protein product [Callosobruchus analis]CAI5828462.1 unnamed protein product [Callosobruchus analis]CAI5829007.1 unnamed protein product [Callosobruchus analis]
MKVCSLHFNKEVEF